MLIYLLQVHVVAENNTLLQQTILLSFLTLLPDVYDIIRNNEFRCLMRFKGNKTIWL